MSSIFSAGRAVVVGIANYSSHVGPLPDMVRKDAADVAARLIDPAISGYDPAAVRLLTNGDATAERIRTALKEEAQKCPADGTLLFYFSGHGGRVKHGSQERSMLIAQDFDGSGTAGQLRDDDLLDIFAQSRTAQQVIILDACHTGAFGALKGGPIGPTPILAAGADFNRLAGGKGRAILSSSRADEVSLALHGMANSLFTAALLDALGGAANDRGDGAIGVFDVFNFVADAVPRRASQHPVFKADVESNFALALKPTSKSVSILPRSAAITLETQAEATLVALYPLGPTQDQIWSRAGGDLSRLALSGHGAAQWHAAVRLLSQGGGGTNLRTLLATAAEDFAGNATIADMLAAS